MKLTLVGSPKEIAEFLALRASPQASSSSASWPARDSDLPIRYDFPTLAFGKPYGPPLVCEGCGGPHRNADCPKRAGEVPPPRSKPPAQTIEPLAIERLEFGVDQAGMPVDVAAIHRTIGELLKNASFQSAAAANMPPIDAFEPPMMHAKRFLMAHCVRDNQFNLAALDAMCQRYMQDSSQACATFAAAPPYQPTDSGKVSVTFEGEKIR